MSTLLGLKLQAFRRCVVKPNLKVSLQTMIRHIFDCIRARFSSYYVTSAAAEYPRKWYVWLFWFIGFSHELPGPANAQDRVAAPTTSVTQETPQAAGA